MMNLQDEKLIELRGKLKSLDELMKRGIFLEEDTKREYFTGYRYKTLYDWDQYFEAIVEIYMGWPSDYIKNAVLIFLDHQLDSGMIRRSVPSNEFHDNEHLKPFLSQICCLVNSAYKESDWLTDRYFSALRKYIDYWLKDMDSNHNGLSEWMSAPHTGMDNQHERAGYWKDRFCEGVDLNSYLYREMKAFSLLAKRRGEKGISGEYSEEADKLRLKIQREMWDERDGFFYDLDMRTGKKIKVKAVSSFTPLWAGVASEEQAKRLVEEHLLNPEEFWSPFPVAVLARSEKGYSQVLLKDDLGCSWRANTWIPLNYMIYHGLKRYKYDKPAALLAEATVSLVEKTGNREYYNSETGEGCGLDPFWGWSLLAHFLPYEQQCGFDITSLDE